MRPRLGAFGWRLAVLAPLLAAGCGDSGPAGPASPPGTRPLIYEYFVHPRWVASGSGFTVRAGVFVGPGSRWVIDSAGFTQHGDSLVLHGTASENGPQTTPPDRTLQYDTLTVTIPSLPDGWYRIVAGDLSDFFEVSVIGPSGADTLLGDARFVAHGKFVERSSSSCVDFEPRSPRFDEVAGWVAMGTVSAVDVAGTLTGDSFASTGCDGDSARGIRIDTFVPGTTMGETQPVVFLDIVHPGVLATNRAGEIQADVYVGPSSCWELLEAGITVLHDTLALSGTGMQTSNEPCARTLRFETATMTIPGLPAGEYVIAAGDHWDDLRVSSYASPTKPSFFASGTLCPRQDGGACGEPMFVPAYAEGLLRPADLMADVPVDRCTLGFLRGTLVGRVDCQGLPRDVVRVRGWEATGR